MSDRLPPAPEPGARRTEAREHRTRWPGLVWAVPAAALLIVLYLGLQAVAHRGVDVVVSFGSAADAKPGDTQVIYKGLSIGRVTKVRLSPDRKRVDMTLRMNPQAEPLLREGTVFWLVGAKPSLTDISSLKAALAGVSIGVAPGNGKPARHFAGLDEPPVVTPGTPGREFLLISRDAGTSNPGSSVFYHGREVGKIISQTLRGQNDFETRIFVQAPYTAYVHRGTLFYNTSPVQVSFGGSGISAQLAPGGAALSGGVEFDTPEEFLDQPMAVSGAHFPLFPDRGRALTGPRGPQVFYTVLFSDPVGDLEVGSPVRLRGFQVGTVSSRALNYEPGTDRLTTPVTLAIEPDRLNPANGLSEVTDDLTAPTDALVSHLLAQGYRARLSQQPPLVGGRVVDLVLVPGAKGGRLTGARGPVSFPVIPATSSGDVNAIMGKVDDILSRVQQVPIEKIGGDVRQITSRLSTLLGSPKLQTSIDSLDDTLKRVDQTVKEVQPKVGPMIDNLNRAADQIQALTTSANALVSTDGATVDASVPGALRQLTDAARSLRSLADYLTRHPEAILRGKAKSQ